MGCRHVAFHGAVRRYYLPAPFLGKVLPACNVSVLSSFSLLIAPSEARRHLSHWCAVEGAVVHLLVLDPVFMAVIAWRHRLGSSIPSVAMLLSGLGLVQHACAGGLGPVVEQSLRRMGGRGGLNGGDSSSSPLLWRGNWRHAVHFCRLVEHVTFGALLLTGSAFSGVADWRAS